MTITMIQKKLKILDKLGYKDRNGDGFREDPNGKPFEINLKHYSGSIQHLNLELQQLKISGKKSV